ncbi:MAG: tetratricopeptide repeat protein [Lachnospiraceae bacterium]|jgi:tetratricopeptide (TPR) repeat protein|nr:tetratricopeptide repeat protein [Lachnospiraceae bacterium]
MDEFYRELDACFASGDLEGAEKLLIRNLTEANDEGNWQRYSQVAGELIAFYQTAGRFEEATAASDDLLLLMEELHLEDSADFAVVLMDHANGFRDGGRLNEAEEYYLRSENTLQALAAAGHGKAQDPQTDRITGTLYSNEALLYLKEGRFTEAEARFRKANALFDEAGAQDDPFYLPNMAGIAEALYRSGDPANALAAYETAIEALRKNDGEGRGCALLYGNCAVICDSMHDPVSAQSYRAKAAAILSKTEN